VAPGKRLQAGEICTFNASGERIQTVKDYDLSPYHGTEKCPANSFVCFGADFKEAITERPCVRHSQVRAVVFHANGQRSKPSAQTDRPGIELGFNSFVEV